MFNIALLSNWKFFITFILQVIRATQDPVRTMAPVCQDQLGRLYVPVKLGGLVLSVNGVSVRVVLYL